MPPRAVLRDLLVDLAPPRVPLLHLAQEVAAVGAMPSRSSAQASKPDLRLRLAVELGRLREIPGRRRLPALRLERAVVDPLGHRRPLQRRVDVPGPGLAPLDQQACGRPTPHLQPRSRGGSRRVDGAGGGHHVTVRLPAAVAGLDVVDREVGDHPARDDALRDEAAGERRSAPRGPARGEGRAGFPSPAARSRALGRLDRVPQALAIGHPGPARSPGPRSRCGRRRVSRRSRARRSASRHRAPNRNGTRPTPRRSPPRPSARLRGTRPRRPPTCPSRGR